MKILLDTNVLLRLEDLDHPQHPIARSAIDALHANAHLLVLVPQVVYEGWVVATRPGDVNGLGLDPARADQMISEWIEIFTLLRDERRVFRFWRELVTLHNVQGERAHDARPVAAMMRHGVDAILTFNLADFGGFPVIRSFSPTDIAAGQLP